MKEQRVRIGLRIKELREAQGFSQIQLAEAIGTHEGNIRRIELGKYDISFDVLQSIAECLGKRIDFI